MGGARLDVSHESMDICRIDAKEECLAALALETREGQAALLDRISQDSPAPLTFAIALAVALPADSIWALPQGPYLWVAASLFFSLLHPALLLLPAFRRRNPAPRQHAYLRTLWSLGILGPGRKLGYLTGNAFVIGTSGVTPAFSWFAVVNLGVALAWVLAGPPSRALGIVIMTQSAIALGFGIVVWRMTPGVGRLRKQATAIQALFAAHRAVGWAVVVLLSVTATLGAVLLFPSLVLAEPTFIRVLVEGQIDPVAGGLEFAVLLVGLYTVTRTVQSRESRRLARFVTEAVIHYIDRDLAPRLADARQAMMDCEEYRALATGLLEARVYRFDRLTVLGRLPVYLLTPDLSLVVDPETLVALRGHLALEPSDSGTAPS